jgi:hypothetical protein
MPTHPLKLLVFAWGKHLHFCSGSKLWPTLDLNKVQPWPENLDHCDHWSRPCQAKPHVLATTIQDVFKKKYFLNKFSIFIRNFLPHMVFISWCLMCTPFSRGQDTGINSLSAFLWWRGFGGAVVRALAFHLWGCGFDSQWERSQCYSDPVSHSYEKS